MRWQRACTFEISERRPASIQKHHRPWPDEPREHNGISERDGQSGEFPRRRGRDRSVHCNSFCFARAIHAGRVRSIVLHYDNGRGLELKVL